MRLPSALTRAAAALLPLAAATLAACSDPIAPDAAPRDRGALAQGAATLADTASNRGPILPWY